MATKKTEVEVGNVLKFKALVDEARLPVYATPGAAAMDLHALVQSSEGVPVTDGSPRVFRTGLAVEVPEGHVMLIFSRSGHGFKNDVRLSNAVAVVDADYRGELMVKLARDGHRGDDLMVFDGDRIAQAMVLPVTRFEPQFVVELGTTERGEGGLGSTGK